MKTENPQNSMQLRHLIPWVAMLIGIVSIFFYSVRDVFNPLILFFVSLYLLRPYWSNPTARRLLIILIILFLLWILFQTAAILTPFIVAAVLAYLLSPIVDKLERKKVHRWLAIIAILVPLITLIVLVFLILTPYFLEQLGLLLKKIPSYMEIINSKTEIFITERLEKIYLPVDVGAAFENLKQSLTTELGNFLRRVPSNLDSFGRGVGAVLTILSYILITPVMTFYILKDFNRIKQQIRKLIPPQHYNEITETLKELDSLIGKYVRGQITVALIVGTMTWLALLIFRVEFSFLLGVLSGLFNVVPYLGVIVAIIPALIVAVATADNVLWGIIKILLIFTAIHQSDGLFITPRIMSKEVGLPPWVIIISILICGYFFKFIGVLIAVPLAAIITFALKKLEKLYFSSDYYKTVEKIDLD